MKTKIIPFDLEIAKKIQSGEIEGRIVQKNGLPAAILAFDINGENLAVRFMRKDGTEGVDEHQPNGKVLAEWCSGSEEFALAIELSEEVPKHEFKVGDKIKVNIPEDELRDYLFLGCYQGKILTVIRTPGSAVAVKGDNLKEQVFPVEWVEPYEETGEPLTFKSFDKVLCRDEVDEEWQCDLFSHIDKDGYCVTVGHCAWRMCIPFEGNEHLVGTTDNPKEE